MRKFFRKAPKGKKCNVHYYLDKDNYRHFYPRRLDAQTACRADPNSVGIAQSRYTELDYPNQTKANLAARLRSEEADIHRIKPAEKPAAQVHVEPQPAIPEARLKQPFTVVYRYTCPWCNRYGYIHTKPSEEDLNSTFLCDDCHLSEMQSQIDEARRDH